MSVQAKMHEPKQRRRLGSPPTFIWHSTNTDRPYSLRTVKDSALFMPTQLMEK